MSDARVSAEGGAAPGWPIDFWFDFSCPYAWLASTQRRTLAATAGVPVRLQPFLLGGVFRAIGQVQNLASVLSPAKARHNRHDLIRWAEWFDVPLRTPLRHPNRTVDALRALLASPEDRWDDVVDALFRVYWAEAADIADPAVLRDRLDRLGLDGADVVQRAQSQTIKDELHRRTEVAVAAGVFGAPAFVVNGQLFWGQDRMAMVARAARGWRPDAAREAFQF